MPKRMADETCRMNEDCIAGRKHAGPCRFPSWTDDANRPCPTCGRKPEQNHHARPPHPDTMIGRKG